MVLVTRPPMTDDSGNFTSGTAVNKAFIDSLLDQVDDQTHSTGTPTVKPKDIISEVINARGASVDLEARLDAADVTVDSLGTPDQVLSSLGRTNLVLDETFLFWAAGDAAAPTVYALAGAGGTVARCGTGLADTNNKIGNFCARIRRVAADTTLVQSLISGNGVLRSPAAFQGKHVGYGAWVRSTAVGGARIYINDGIGTTYSIANVLANTWEWLSVERTLSASATTIVVGLINDVNAADAYISGLTVFLGDTGGAPTEWVPAPVIYTTVDFFIPGNLAVTTPKIVWSPHRPCLVRSIEIAVATAPTVAAILVDVNTWDGAAYTSMLTAGTRAQIAAGGTFGGASIGSGTYARRCLRMQDALTTAAGTRLSIDIDQVGGGATGADMTVSIRLLVPARFYETILDYNDVGA